MSKFQFVSLIVMTGVNVAFLFIAFMENTALIIERNNFSLKEFTILDMLLFIPIIPAVGLYLIFTKLNMPYFFTSKPFKRSSFKIGESVFHEGRQCIVIENESHRMGNTLRVQMGNGSSYTCEASSVRKESKLEKSLK